MNRVKLRFFYLFLLLLQFSNVHVFANQIKFAHIDITQGLSNNRVLCFAEDNNGFVWIGTTSGLNRFDGYNVKTLKHNIGDSTSLPDNIVSGIQKDQLGRFWILTTKGYVIFNPDNETFNNDFIINTGGNIYNLSGVSQVLPFKKETLLFLMPQVGIIAHNIVTGQNNIVPLTASKSILTKPEISSLYVWQNKLYVIFNNGNIHIVDVENGYTDRIVNDFCTLQDDKVNDYKLFVDKVGDIWVYSADSDIGLFQIDSAKCIKHFNTHSNPKLNSNIITNIEQDNNGNYWIGTDHGGLNIMNTDKTTIDIIKNDESDKSSLSQDVITSIYKSKNGVFWIGTYKKGANYYHENLFKFDHYIHSVNNSKSLPYNDVNCFAEDAEGNLWIGTNGFGLIYFDRKHNEYKTYKADLNNSKALQSNVIVSLYFDKNNQLWIGTYHGGLSVYNNGIFKTYLHNPNDLNSLANNRVWEIFEDTRGNLWIGTLGGGLNKLDQETGKFQHFNGSGANAINSQFIMEIHEDADANVWFGTDAGLYVLEANSTKFVEFQNNPNEENSLSDNFVSVIFSDSKNNLWFGTRSGLNLFVSETNTFKTINTHNGLPDNSVMSMLESDNGDLWVATSGGLCQLTVTYNVNGKYESHSTVNYYETDGLQGREFNEGSAFKTSNGELVFGGANGFNIFKPKNNESGLLKLNTYIVGLSILGKPISKESEQAIGKGLQTSLLNNSTIKLSFKENMFTIQFVSLNILESQKIKYRYKLDGFNENWIYTDAIDRKATFTNLNPGNYTFLVQASLMNSDWHNSQATLSIIVRPPWYRTWLAYFLYYAFIVAVIIFARRIVIARERIKYLHQEAELESARQQELNALKTRFFTNVSHEFRTPLTLILTPLEKLLKADIQDDTRRHLQLMNQNAKRLLGLVNQLLDFRKAEENKLNLNLIYGNVIGFIDVVVNSFTDYKESKNIKLEFLPEEKELFMQFDKDKVEKILMNLLSNAFKFTPDGGNIKVFVDTINKKGIEYLKIKVEDTGIGISEQDQEKIFERFYQSELPGEFITKGSGIGLSLTADFVKLHGGTISVKSNEGVGSKFIVKLPINRTPAVDDDISEHENVQVDFAKESAGSNEDNQEQIARYTLLLTEDNADFRYYLKDSLKHKYQILEASNGKKALDILENENVDLLISDVMMPEMDGFELCELIKSNADYSHIPVVLLTAKSTQQDKLEGLKHGADEYITKPFNFDILEARVEYLLGLRKKFIHEYQQSFKVKVDDKRVTPLDKKLLDKAMDLINTNISNSEFSVEGMSKELGMSRVYLYKKLSALTGKTPIELIRLVRLKKAAELLIQGELNVSEITYEVGFSDPKYFSKMFKAEFGKLPSRFKDTQ